PLSDRPLGFLTRRAALKLALAATSLTALPRTVSAAASSSRPNLIDVNVTLSRWPLRRLRGDDTPALLALLRSYGVRQAWAGTFDGLLHKDIAAANNQLAEQCHRHGRDFLLPFGSIN